jgi:hypothetical protein
MPVMRDRPITYRAIKGREIQVLAAVRLLERLRVVRNGRRVRGEVKW